MILKMNKIKIPNRYCILNHKHSLRYDDCGKCSVNLPHFNKCIDKMKEKTLYKIPIYIKNNPDLFATEFNIFELKWYYWKL